MDNFSGAFAIGMMFSSIFSVSACIGFLPFDRLKFFFIPYSALKIIDLIKKLMMGSICLRKFIMAW
jgi:hypothetical protein